MCCFFVIDQVTLRLNLLLLHLKMILLHFLVFSDIFGLIFLDFVWQHRRGPPPAGFPPIHFRNLQSYYCKAIYPWKWRVAIPATLMRVEYFVSSNAWELWVARFPVAQIEAPVPPSRLKRLGLARARTQIWACGAGVNSHSMLVLEAALAFDLTPNSNIPTTIWEPERKPCAADLV